MSSFTHKMNILSLIKPHILAHFTYAFFYSSEV